jgi:hypothetical protein
MRWHKHFLKFAKGNSNVPVAGRTLHRSMVRIVLGEPVISWFFLSGSFYYCPDPALCFQFCAEHDKARLQVERAWNQAGRFPLQMRSFQQSCALA